MLKQGDLFEIDGKKFLALANPYVRFVQDPDAWWSRHDYGSAYRFVTAQPVEPVGPAVTFKLDGKQVKIISNSQQ